MLGLTGEFSDPQGDDIGLDLGLVLPPLFLEKEANLRVLSQTMSRMFTPSCAEYVVTDVVSEGVFLI